jgi:hypothetical protein
MLFVVINHETVVINHKSYANHRINIHHSSISTIVNNWVVVVVCS